MRSAGNSASEIPSGGEAGLYVYNVRSAEAAGDCRLDLLVFNATVDGTALEGAKNKLVESGLVLPGLIRCRKMLFTVRPAAGGGWNDIVEGTELPRWRVVADLISEALGLETGFIVHGGTR